MSKSFNAIRMTLTAGATALVFAGGAFAQLDTALQVARQSTQAGAAAQSQVNDLADAANDAERQYLALQEQIESQRVYLEQQRVFLRSQENELAALRSQLERVGSIERDLTPMLLEMYIGLEAFINQDLPYQLGERQDRLGRIEEALGDSQISPSEKYRLMINAFEIESAAGRSLRAYSQEVEVNGVPELAEILQIGRVAMIRDIGGNMEIMTKDNPTWRPVPGSMAADVQRAFRIAKELTTPSVFAAPLPGPVAQ
jgi:hypothetical protein